MVTNIPGNSISQGQEMVEYVTPFSFDLEGDFFTFGQGVFSHCILVEYTVFCPLSRDVLFCVLKEVLITKMNTVISGYSDTL